MFYNAILSFYLPEQQLAAAQASQPQDLGLARLGALGALADLADGAVGGADLLNEVPSTINYEDLIGNQAAAHAGKHSSIYCNVHDLVNNSEDALYIRS